MYTSEIWGWQTANSGLEKDDDNNLNRQQNKLTNFIGDKWKYDSNEEHRKKEVDRCVRRYNSLRQGNEKENQRKPRTSFFRCKMKSMNFKSYGVMRKAVTDGNMCLGRQGIVFRE